jgi:hypothetical protein
MENDVDPVERAIQPRFVANVGLKELGFTIQIAGNGAVMDLRLQIIVNANLVPVGDKAIHDVAADEAGATGYEYLHA